MIKKFKKILVLFLFFSTYQLVYSQAPDLNISLDNSNLNGQCAPLDIDYSNRCTWPESNPRQQNIFLYYMMILNLNPTHWLIQ